MAHQQLVIYHERLSRLNELEQRFAHTAGRALRMLAARLGRRVYEVALEFWQEIADGPPSPAV